jgi:PEP-CTERM motif
MVQLRWAHAVLAKQQRDKRSHFKQPHKINFSKTTFWSLRPQTKNKQLEIIMKNYNSFIMSCAVIAFAGSASAANVTWGTPTGVSSSADVSTLGTLEYSVSFASSNTTVNGVVFSNSGANYLDGFFATLPSGFMGSTTFIDANDTEGQAYAALLDGGRYNDTPLTTGNFSLSNLTIGQDYLMQFWVSDYRNFNLIRTQTVTGGSNTSAPLQYLNGANANAIHGSYVIGTFTADTTSQAFGLTANQDTLVNAVQLRNVTIPEPSTTLLGALGAVALLRRRRA